MYLMAKFFRLQIGSYTLEQMQNYTSEDGGDGGESGICATRSVDELKRNTVYPLINNPNAEVVVLKAHNPTEIYDGVRIAPEAILNRFTGAQWQQMVADGGAYDLED